MGVRGYNRSATDGKGNVIEVIGWGDRGTAQMFDDADLKDPRFFPEYTLADGATKLTLINKDTLLNPDTGEELKLVP